MLNSIGLFFRITISLIFLAMLLTSFDALAADPGSLEGTVCNVVSAMQGPIARGIAALAIIFLGFSLFLGKISWGIALALAIGIGAVFGANEIVDKVAGGGRSCQGVISSRGVATTSAPTTVTGGAVSSSGTSTSNNGSSNSSASGSNNSSSNGANNSSVQDNTTTDSNTSNDSNILNQEDSITDEDSSVDEGNLDSSLDGLPSAGTTSPASPTQDAQGQGLNGQTNSIFNGSTQDQQSNSIGNGSESLGGNGVTTDSNILVNGSTANDTGSSSSTSVDNLVSPVLPGTALSTTLPDLTSDEYSDSYTGPVFAIVPDGEGGYYEYIPAPPGEDPALGATRKIRVHQPTSGW